MRSRQAFRNVLSSIVLQLIIALTGIYIPQLMISTYGSDMNGMISSITQFITYLGLVEAGIGNATIVALYAPLADRDYAGINSVMAATRNFYRKSSAVYLLLLLGLTGIYPVFLEGDLEPSLARWMVLILGSSLLVDFFFFGKYRVLLTADQRGYIVTMTQSIGTILNSVICILMMYAKCNILLVKAVATVVYILRTLYIWRYVRRNYEYLDFAEKPNKVALKQRWDVLIHQITGVIVSSTDVVVLTVVLKNFVEISVYTTYNLIASNFISLIDSFSSGLCAGFGEIYAKNEKEIMRRSYSTYEYIYYILLFSCCTCMGILIIPFMKLYTVHITDADYIRPVTAMLFVFITISRGLRTPALTMIMAAGHYTQTRRAAVIEAVINISVSLMLVRIMGINGVLIGTVCSYIYRTIDMIIYSGKKLMQGTLADTAVRVVRNGVIGAIVFFIFHWVPVTLNGWAGWILYAVASGTIVVSTFVLVNGVFEPVEFKQVLKTVGRMVKK